MIEQQTTDKSHRLLALSRAFLTTPRRAKIELLEFLLSVGII
jgi:hypothetical protein